MSHVLRYDCGWASAASVAAAGSFVTCFIEVIVPVTNGAGSDVFDLTKPGPDAPKQPQKAALSIDSGLWLVSFTGDSSAPFSLEHRVACDPPDLTLPWRLIFSPLARPVSSSRFHLSLSRNCNEEEL